MYRMRQSSASHARPDRGCQRDDSRDLSDEPVHRINNLVTLPTQTQSGDAQLTNEDGDRTHTDIARRLHKRYYYIIISDHRVPAAATINRQKASIPHAQR